MNPDLYDTLLVSLFLGLNLAAAAPLWRHQIARLRHVLHTPALAR